MALLCRWVVPLEAKAVASVFYLCSRLFPYVLISWYSDALAISWVPSVHIWLSLLSTFLLYLPLKLFTKLSQSNFLPVYSTKWLSCIFSKVYKSYLFSNSFTLLAHFISLYFFPLSLLKQLIGLYWIIHRREFCVSGQFNSSNKNWIIQPLCC